MSYVGSTVVSTATDAVILPSHPFVGSHTDQRTVLVVLTPATTTITNIYERFTTTDGGFTARATYTAQGRKLWLFDKICGPSEAHQYEVHFTPASSGGVNAVIGFLADFTTTGDPIAAHAFADSASGTALTLPSVQATNGDDIYALVWSDPLVSVGRLRPQSPLSTSGNSSFASNAYMENAREVWQSSSPTGTRQFAVASGSHEGAIGVILLVGGFAPSAGGWGVGAIRMGTN